jgi:hypothetical protein
MIEDPSLTNFPHLDFFSNSTNSGKIRGFGLRFQGQGSGLPGLLLIADHRRRGGRRGGAVRSSRGRRQMGRRWGRGADGNGGGKRQRAAMARVGGGLVRVG